MTARFQFGDKGRRITEEGRISRVISAITRKMIIRFHYNWKRESL
jgi:hypothetical protein